MTVEFSSFYGGGVSIVNAILPNDEYLKGRRTDGTIIDLIGVDTNNDIAIGHNDDTPIVRIGSSLVGPTTVALAFGPDNASTAGVGTLRWMQNQSIWGRNAANTLDSRIISWGEAGADLLTIGDDTSCVGILFRAASGEFAFNGGSNDVDFRVESNGNTHALFVDAGNNRVGILNNAPATALDVTGSIQASSDLLAGRDVRAAAAQYVYWAGRATLSSPADSLILIQNQAATDFDRLQFGGTSAAFPALKRSGAGLQVRTASDSAYAAIDALSYAAGGVAGFNGTVAPPVTITVTNGIVTNVA